MVLLLADKRVPEPTTRRTKRAARDLERTFLANDFTAILTTKQVSAAAGANKISAMEKARVLALGATVHPLPDAIRWTAQYLFHCTDILAADPTEAVADELYAHMSDMAALADHADHADQRDLIETSLYHARSLRASVSDTERAETKRALSRDLAARGRIDLVNKAPKLGTLLARLNVNPGTEETPVEVIAANIFDQDKSLLLDRFEAQFSTSTGSAILEALNRASWAGDRMTGSLTPLQDALRAVNRSGTIEDDRQFVIGTNPHDDDARTLAIGVLAVAGAFRNYLANATKLQPGLIAGQFPAVQISDATPGHSQYASGTTQINYLLTPAEPNEFDHVCASLISIVPGAGLGTVMTHELAHAFENSGSHYMVNAGGFTPVESKAISESTADYIGNRVSGNWNPEYEAKYDVQAMMAAVLKQIGKARGMTSDDHPIGFDILLRAHFSYHPDAVQELQSAWKHVLNTPKYKARYRDDSSMTTTSIMGAAAVAAAVAAAAAATAWQYAASPK